ncbi:hypothetical protein ALO_16906 [Acetonema longum DSM 6540]|uniref:Uncharacterized protein n=1 Tax=Acetonema longum DSM 6540 TaxID=1009370 RepID=F7NMQ0_9FIRM|nr:hypothetical protein ALO_16906 [Acetonema longum DSM 6540]
MEKFIPFEKLSKKKQREHNARERRDWGCNESGHPCDSRSQGIWQKQGKGYP